MKKNRFKIISNHYNANGNDCFVEIIDRKRSGRHFTGSASVHPDDRDRISEWEGYRIAQRRAEIKALKSEYKELKTECEGIRKFLNILKNDCILPKSVLRKLTKQFQVKLDQVNNLADRINSAEAALSQSFRNRDRILKKIESK